MTRLPLIALLAGCGPSNKDTGSSAWPIDAETGLRVNAIPPVPTLDEWDENPSSDAKLALGLAIFNDRRLSGSGFTTCSTCHLPTGAFTSGLEHDLPDRAYPETAPTLARNSPSLLNQVYAPTYHWDGRPSDVFEVWVLPFGEPQMNLTDLPYDDIWSTDDETAQIELKERFTTAIPGYVDWFSDAFGVDIQELEPEEVWHLAGQAIAVYMRKAVSKNSPFDAWNQGDDSAMEADAIRGVELFIGDAGCTYCHTGALLSDFQYHNLSLTTYDDDGEIVDPGRYRVSGDENDIGSFLTPMLRSVTQSSPYFHDGSVLALRDAISHHVSPAAVSDPLHDPILDALPVLTDAEVEDIVAFLKTLRGETIEQKYLTVLPDMPQ